MPSSCVKQRSTPVSLINLYGNIGWKSKDTFNWINFHSSEKNYINILNSIVTQICVAFKEISAERF